MTMDQETIASFLLLGTLLLSCITIIIIFTMKNN